MKSSIFEEIYLLSRMPHKAFHALALISLWVSACGATISSPEPTLTPISQATTAKAAQAEFATPTAPRPTPTTELTATPTEVPIPMIQVGELSVPDPRVINPELFDLTKKDAPIPQFVNAMKMANITITAQKVLEGILFQPQSDGNVRIIYIFDPDPNKKGEMFEGVVTLARTIKSPDGRIIWKAEGLGDEFTSQNMLFGIAIHNRDGKLSKSEDTQFINNEATLIVTEDGLEWRYVHIAPADNFSWSRADEQINFAIENNKIVRGHPLVDTASDRLPNWLKRKVISYDKQLKQNPNDTVLKNKIREEFIKHLDRHISTVVGHYKDRVDEWVVLNELLAENNFWLRFIGEDYIKIAIDSARNANPSARLIVSNEYQVELKNQKSNAYYNLIRSLKKAGVIHENDGIGFQFHVSAKDPGLTKDAIKSNLRRFMDLGLTVDITELDIFDVLTNNPNDLIKQASILKNIVSACSELNAEYGRPVVTSVTTWGYKDGDSWLYSALVDHAGYPLLVTSSLQKKPLYFAALMYLINQ